jgi:nitroimidazol reductase NimA-like FMN-containing flavoprotein (pyridoxamine 5'-phosphate oxidase superfamily)
MKTFEGLKGIGMSERGTRKFLAESKSTLNIATINSDGTPIIHPVWYHFDSQKTKIYFYTEPSLKKTINIKERGEMIYFDVDSDKWPYKGVKGKGSAKIILDQDRAISLGKKILTKYVKKGRPLIKSALEKIKDGGYVIIEITPAYFTSWDFEKILQQEPSLRNSMIS